MDVKLLYYTQDPERAIATAARLCYSADDAVHLNESLTDKEIEHLLYIILSGGHHSALEHASYTFSIHGISRACTHQLVRHRLASYNQQSQRYVKFDNNNLEIVVPKSIESDEVALKEFMNAIEACKLAYSNLCSLDIPKEDARYVLPNAASSNIVVTMNARELLHFFSLRCCNRAQWEIRELAWAMRDLVVKTAPQLFAQAGPECIRSKCREGKMSCGNPYRSYDVDADYA